MNETAEQSVTENDFWSEVVLWVDHHSKQYTLWRSAMLHTRILRLTLIGRQPGQVMSAEFGLHEVLPPSIWLAEFRFRTAKLETDFQRTYAADHR